jgi:WD40 repeat protein
VVQLALAPDGKTVAAVRAFTDTTLFGTSGRTLFNLEVFVFDATDPPKEPKPLWAERNVLADKKEFTAPVSLAFSPDGKTLLAAFADPYTDNPKERGTVPKSMGVKVWTLGEGKIKAPVPKATETEWKEGKPIQLKDGARITAVTFSPDGNTVVVGQKSDVIAIDAKTREERHIILRMKEAENQIFRIRYQPDSTRLGIANRNSYGLAALPQPRGSQDYSTWAGQMTNVALSPDGTRFAASDGRTAKVHSVPRKGNEQPLQFGPLDNGENGMGDIPSALAFSPKGDQLLLLPNVRVPADWQPDPKAEFSVPDQKAATHWIAVVWPMGGKQAKALKHGTARITAADWSADGKHIVTADEKGTLIVWDGETFEEKRRVELGDGVVQLALAPDGKTVAAVRVAVRIDAGLSGVKPMPTEYHDWSLGVYALADIAEEEKPKPAYSWKHSQFNPVKGAAPGPASLAFSPDGKTLLAAFADPHPDADNPKERGVVPKSMGLKVWELVPKK